MYVIESNFSVREAICYVKYWLKNLILLHNCWLVVTDKCLPKMSWQRMKKFSPASDPMVKEVVVASLYHYLYFQELHKVMFRDYRHISCTHTPPVLHTLQMHTHHQSYTHNRCTHTTSLTHITDAHTPPVLHT